MADSTKGIEVKLKDLYDKYNDLIKPSGALPCMNKKISDKVPWKLFVVILFFVIAGMSTLIEITYSKAGEAQAEHKELATKTEVAKIEENLKDDIEEIKDNVEKIKGNMTRMEINIIRAIEKR